MVDRSLRRILRFIIMLILTRRAGESLVIGDNITITVLAIKGNQIRLGIDAPKDVSVHRQEIQLKINKAGSNDFFTKDSLSGSDHDAIE